MGVGLFYVVAFVIGVMNSDNLTILGMRGEGDPANFFHLLSGVTLLRGRPALERGQRVAGQEARPGVAPSRSGVLRAGPRARPSSCSAAGRRSAPSSSAAGRRGSSSTPSSASPASARTFAASAARVERVGRAAARRADACDARTPSNSSRASSGRARRPCAPRCGRASAAAAGSTAAKALEVRRAVQERVGREVGDRELRLQAVADAVERRGLARERMDGDGDLPAGAPARRAAARASAASIARVRLQAAGIGLDPVLARSRRRAPRAWRRASPPPSATPKASRSRRAPGDRAGVDAAPAAASRAAWTPAAAASPTCSALPSEPNAARSPPARSSASAERGARALAVEAEQPGRGDRRAGAAADGGRMPAAVVERRDGRCARARPSPRSRRRRRRAPRRCRAAARRRARARPARSPR